MKHGRNNRSENDADSVRSMREIIDVIWRGTDPLGRCVGLVLVRGEDSKLRAYIGVGDGMNEQSDEEWIMNYGIYLTLEEARVFFAQLSEEDYGEKL